MSDRYDNAGGLIHEPCGNAHDPAETTCAEAAGEVPAPERYTVTFVFVDGTTHTLRSPKTLAQIGQYQDTLDARLHPRPPREDPDELPTDDAGQPVWPVPKASLRFDFGDQGLIVPASQISHIHWERA